MKMTFYNREKEIKRLVRAFSSVKPKLIVLYGRRRCGKSTLLRQVLAENDFYFVAPQADEAIQRAQLANVIAAQIKGFDQVVYPDWESLFINLHNSLDRPVTLCLDEFPYLFKSSTSLPSVLQKIVDQMQDRRFHLVLCGSSQQMMHGLVLDRTAPLYGRSDEILKIIPLEAGWIMESLNCGPDQAIIEYATWGGVPRYWEIRREYEDYEEAVKDIILDRLGILHEEPTRLLLDDLRETVQANSLLSLVGQGNHKLSEIAGRLQKPSTHLSNPLNKLIQLGYIKREIPFGESSRSTKRTLYKMEDPFLGFFFSFVAPNLSRLELGLTEAVFDDIQPKLKHHIAGEWEKMCRRSVPMAPVMGIPFDKASRWWGVNANGEKMELDVVSESIDKKHLLVGECKWTEIQDPLPILSQLTAKAQLLPKLKGRTIVPVLFVRSLRSGSGASPAIFTPAEVLPKLR